MALAVKAAVRGSLKAHSGKFLTSIGKRAYEESYAKVLKYAHKHRNVSYDKISKIVNDYVVKKPKYKPHAEKFLADLSSALGRINLKYWKRADVAGKRVYQRNDLFNLETISKIKRKGKGITVNNLERMRLGNAPVGKDGKSIELHHALQRDSDALIEVSNVFHKKNTSVIHINPTSIRSGINRNKFGAWTKKYWKERARKLQ